MIKTVQKIDGIDEHKFGYQRVICKKRAKENGKCSAIRVLAKQKTEFDTTGNIMYFMVILYNNMGQHA